MPPDAAEAKFEEIYRAHQRQVAAYFLRRTDEASARDGTAETFLVAWRQIDRVPANAALPWLYAVARRVLSNIRRTQRRRKALGQRLSDTGADQEASPEAIVVRRAQDDDLSRAIARLRPEDQEVILLAVWEELPYADIAVALRTSPNAVAQRMQRIIKRLQRDLERPNRVRRPRSVSRAIDRSGWA